MTKTKHTLTLTPKVYAKICHMRDSCKTEVGGFGIGAVDNFLHIEDFIVLEQEATASSFEWKDEAVGQYFDNMLDLGLSPHRYNKVWIHTHPGASVTPSKTDEDTQRDCFGDCSWSVMLIVGSGGELGAKLFTNASHINPEDGTETKTRYVETIDALVKYNCPFGATTQEDLDHWTKLTTELVKPKVYTSSVTYNRGGGTYNTQTGITTYNYNSWNQKNKDTSLVKKPSFPTDAAIKKELIRLQKACNFTSKGLLVYKKSGVLVPYTTMTDLTYEATLLWVDELYITEPKHPAIEKVYDVYMPATTPELTS